MDRVAGQYAIYGLYDVILNTEGRMQMRYNITRYLREITNELLVAIISPDELLPLIS